MNNRWRWRYGKIATEEFERLGIGPSPRQKI